MKAFDIKKGNVVEHNGGVYQIRDIERSSPQGRGGNVRFRFIMYSVPGGNKLDASFDADDNLSEVELLRRQATYSYKDGDAFVFLDDEDYTPYTLDANVIGDDAGYITDGLSGCYVQVIDDYVNGLIEETRVLAGRIGTQRDVLKPYESQWLVQRRARLQSAMRRDAERNSFTFVAQPKAHAAVLAIPDLQAEVIERLVTIGIAIYIAGR